MGGAVSRHTHPVVPDKRSEAERRSGTHDHREWLCEDSEGRPSLSHDILWLWIPGLRLRLPGTTPEFVDTPADSTFDYAACSRLAVQTPSPSAALQNPPTGLI